MSENVYDTCTVCTTKSAIPEKLPGISINDPSHLSSKSSGNWFPVNPIAIGMEPHIVTVKHSAKSRKKKRNYT